MGMINNLLNIFSNASKKSWDIYKLYSYLANWKIHSVLPHSWEFPDSIYLPSKFWDLCRKMSKWSDSDHKRRAFAIYKWGEDYIFGNIDTSYDGIAYPKSPDIKLIWEETPRIYYYNKVFVYNLVELLRKEIYVTDFNNYDTWYTHVLGVSTHVAQYKDNIINAENKFYDTFSLKEIAGLIYYESGYIVSFIVTDKLELLCKTAETKFYEEYFKGNHTYSEIYKGLNLIHYESNLKDAVLRRTEQGV